MLKLSPLQIGILVAICIGLGYWYMSRNKSNDSSGLVSSVGNPCISNCNVTCQNQPEITRKTCEQSCWRSCNKQNMYGFYDPRCSFECYNKCDKSLCPMQDSECYVYNSHNINRCMSDCIEYECRK